MHFLNTRHQFVIIRLTFRTANDLSDFREKYIHGTHSLTILILFHIEGLYFLRIVSQDHRTFKVVFHQITLVFRSQINSPVNREFEFMSFGNSFFQYFNTFRVWQTGEVFFELLVDGESKGTVKSTVVADPSSIVGGFPVWWDFSSESKPTLMADPHNYSWGAGSQYPCEDSAPSTDHKYLDWSDRGGYLTVVCSTASGWGYGEGHCYMKGLQKDDYWLMAFPVKNLKEGTRIAFEAAVGCSGSGARYYALEYSADGTNWFLAEGAETVTGVDGSTGPAHYTVMTDQALPNDKTPACGWASYTFPVEGCSVTDGLFYVRLRVSLDIRLNASATTYTISKTGSERLKGIVKVSLPE